MAYLGSLADVAIGPSCGGMAIAVVVVVVAVEVEMLERRVVHTVDSGTPHRPPPRRMVARIRQRSCDWAITPAGVEMHSEEAVRHGEASNRFDVPLPDDLATWAAVVQSFRMRSAWSSTLQK